MADYQLYFLPADETTFLADDIQAVNDTSAIEIARTRAHGRLNIAELWQGTRLVHRDPHVRADGKVGIRIRLVKG